MKLCDSVCRARAIEDRVLRHLIWILICMDRTLNGNNSIALSSPATTFHTSSQTSNQNRLGQGAIHIQDRTRWNLANMDQNSTVGGGEREPVDIGNSSQLPIVFLKFRQEDHLHHGLPRISKGAGAASGLCNIWYVKCIKILNNINSVCVFRGHHRDFDTNRPTKS